MKRRIASILDLSTRRTPSWLCRPASQASAKRFTDANDLALSCLRRSSSILTSSWAFRWSSLILGTYSTPKGCFRNLSLTCSVSSEWILVWASIYRLLNDLPRVVEQWSCASGNTAHVCRRGPATDCLPCFSFNFNNKSRWQRVNSFAGLSSLRSHFK